jgi:hypothetical protein
VTQPASNNPMDLPRGSLSARASPRRRRRPPVHRPRRCSRGRAGLPQRREVA